MTIDQTVKTAEQEFRQADNIRGIVDALGAAAMVTGVGVASVAPPVGVPLAVAGLALSAVGKHFTTQDKSVAEANLNGALTAKHTATALAEGTVQTSASGGKKLTATSRTA